LLVPVVFIDVIGLVALGLGLGFGVVLFTIGFVLFTIGLVLFIMLVVTDCVTNVVVCVLLNGVVLVLELLRQFHMLLVHHLNLQ
jgi:hypothetical protein